MEVVQPARSESKGTGPRGPALSRRAGQVRPSVRGPAINIVDADTVDICLADVVLPEVGDAGRVMAHIDASVPR